MSAIGASWILGFLVMIVLAACINPDLNAVLASPFGQPMAQVSVFYRLGDVSVPDTE
jgi:hypothetical protein